MKVEARIFLGVTLFLLASAAVYGPWSKDPIGTTALVLSGGLCGLCGSYFWFVSRRIMPRPEDRHDAEIAEGAGELGFFSPGSYWPLGIGLSATLAGVGVVFWQPWILFLGALAVLTTVGGLLFEYYTGQGHA